tara:strand:- start:73773 stop:73934 length:162 start_codon:yes stop_codon:yes gene_type:complete
LDKTGKQVYAALRHCLQPQKVSEIHSKTVKSGAGMLDLFFALKNRGTAVDKSV